MSEYRANIDLRTSTYNFLRQCILYALWVIAMLSYIRLLCLSTTSALCCRVTPPTFELPNILYEYYSRECVGSLEPTTLTSILRSAIHEDSSVYYDVPLDISTVYRVIESVCWVPLHISTHTIQWFTLGDLCVWDTWIVLTVTLYVEDGDLYIYERLGVLC